MSVAKVLEISADSPKGFQAAAEEGLSRVRKTLDDVQGAWIKEQKVIMGSDGRPTYRVDMKVTFVMKD